MATTAATLPELVRARVPGPGGCRLVTVDGFSGSGKSVLAADLGRTLGAPVLSIEELYPGWDGLAAAVPLALRWIADPLFHGRAARWWPWDWELDRRARTSRTQPVVPIVVLEGCGAGARPLRPLTSTAVWVGCPADLRERRLQARADRRDYAPHRAAFARAESAHFAADRTAEHADVVIAS